MYDCVVGESGAKRFETSEPKTAWADCHLNSASSRAAMLLLAPCRHQVQLGPPSSRLRQDLSPYLTVTPDFGYVQGGGSLPISLALCPKADMVQRLARSISGPPEEVRTRQVARAPVSGFR